MDRTRHTVPFLHRGSRIYFCMFQKLNLDHKIANVGMATIADNRHRSLGKAPNIISLMGYSFSEDGIILVTNFVKGCNLDKLLFGKQAIQVGLG